MDKPETEQETALSEEEVNDLVRGLLHKEGNWVQWGQGCQQLQKAGYSAQSIFENTGFQASQQNLVIVAAQVYESLVKSEVEDKVLDYFLGPCSDVLYEFRILTQEQRAQAAKLAMSKNLDVDGAHEIAKAIKEYSRLPQLPSGFTSDPGDAVAYDCWKKARQKKDLQQRSRLIAQGLKFAHSPSAREAIERLLSDFTIVPVATAPIMPVYRLEQEEELPRIIPLAGTFPLSKEEFQQAESLTSEEPFRIINPTRLGQYIPIPGWPSILKAIEPVGILAQSDSLPNLKIGKPEQVLVVVERQLQEWNINSYFLVEKQNTLEVQWLEEPNSTEILGQVILILRPKKILDENVITQPWQMDD